jgi:succinate-acetate transporter protein
MMPLAIADRPTFDPLNAAGLLLGVLFACVGIGALVGWLAGSTGAGIAVGSVVGIPLAIFAVYRAYRNVV